MTKRATKLPAAFRYEAGPTGYGLHRQIVALGHPCMAAAPSLILKRPGDRVKTNRRDAVTQAKLLRAGELAAAWVPDLTHQAIRDLTGRAKRRWKIRGASVSWSPPSCCGTAGLPRQVDLVVGTRAGWPSYFEHPAQRIVLQEALNAVTDAVERLARLEAALVEIVPGWTMAPVGAAGMSRSMLK